jgi:type IV secretory pathway TrbL component
VSKRICILTPAQAAQLERQGSVPRCRWHHHCSEIEAFALSRAGKARIVRAAEGCKHAKPAIVLIVKKVLRSAPSHLGASISGAPQLRTWQLVR